MVNHVGITTTPITAATSEEMGCGQMRMMWSIDGGVFRSEGEGTLYSFSRSTIPIGTTVVALHVDDKYIAIAHSLD